MASRKYVLVTGDIRDRSACMTAIETAVALTSRVSGEGVVLATWANREAEVREIVSQFDAASKIEVVLAPALEKDRPGNPLRQAVLLHRGLADLEADDVVLKMRTDKSDTMARRFEPKFLNFDKIDPPNGTVFKNRIGVSHYAPIIPFMYADGCLLGSQGDLQKMANIDLIVESGSVMSNPPPPEQCLHISAFWQSRPWMNWHFLKEYAVDGVIMDGARTREDAWQFAKNKLSNVVFARAVYDSLCALRDNYSIALVGDTRERGDLSNHFSTLEKFLAGLGETDIALSVFSVGVITTASVMPDEVLSLPVEVCHGASLREMFEGGE